MTITTTSIVKKLLLLFLIVAGLYFGKIFLVPLSIGGVLATLFLPVCKWLERRKIPAILAVTTCLLIFLILVAGMASVLSWQISDLANDFVSLKQKAVEIGTRLQEYIFDTLGIAAAKQNQILQDEQPSVSAIVQLMLGSVTYLITTFILVSAYLFLLLYYRSHLQNFILKLTPHAQQREMREVIGSVALVSQQYLIGLAKMIGLLWIMYGIGFTLLGIEHALFFAVLCGFLEIIPFIGNLTGTSFTVAAAASQGASTPLLFGIVITYIIVQFIQGWILEPMIVGPQVKINPFTTVVVLVLGGLLWGIPGIFLAIPLTAMLKIVCDHIESLKPFGFLIGEIESKKKISLLLKRGG